MSAKVSKTTKKSAKVSVSAPKKTEPSPVIVHVVSTHYHFDDYGRNCDSESTVKKAFHNKRDALLCAIEMSFDNIDYCHGTINSETMLELVGKPTYPKQIEDNEDWVCMCHHLMHMFTFIFAFIFSF